MEGIDELKDSLEDLKQHYEYYDSLVADLHQNREAAVEPLRQKMDEVRASFEPDIQAAVQNWTSWGNKIDEVQNALWWAGVKGDYANLADQGVIKSVEDFKAWHMFVSNSRHVFYNDSKVEAKRQKNGLKFVRTAAGECSYSDRPKEVKYFAFDGLRLVGFHLTENPDHRGDYTDTLAFVGVQDFAASENLKVKKEIFIQTATLREWKKHLEGLSADEVHGLDAVEVSDAGNQRILFQ